ncbi:MAG: ABC transporter substrate-binding protein [Desulfobacterales bacterium]|nr:ABC transporter substrate-binding protein [Desulfobacterales bacterium]
MVYRYGGKPHRLGGWAVVLLVVLLASVSTAAEKPWEQVLAEARGQTVDWFMWGGSPAVNKYVHGYVIPRVRDLYGIELRQGPVKDIAEVVGKLVIEKQAGKTSGGHVDLMWINGENFRTCKKNGLLFGPFAQRLPNQRFVDWSRPTVANDFGEPVEGLESPWGSAQVVMIYDQARITDPPRSIGGLLEWIRRNPGRFAYPAPPDFTGSVFVRHVFYHLNGDIGRWQGSYSRDDLQAAADRTYRVLRDLAPSLWRGGGTYPESPVRMNALFVDGEIDFAFSYHPAEASRNILDGLFPDTVRTYVFEEGTIANTHFVAIPFNAAASAGAMVVADFLLSPEAQLVKADPVIWGDFPAIDSGRLPPEWQTRFATRPRGPATLTEAELQAHQLPEPPSEVLVHLEKGWERHVLKGR